MHGGKGESERDGNLLYFCTGGRVGEERQKEKQEDHSPPSEIQPPAPLLSRAAALCTYSGSLCESVVRTAEEGSRVESIREQYHTLINFRHLTVFVTDFLPIADFVDDRSYLFSERFALYLDEMYHIAKKNHLTNLPNRFLSVLKPMI